MSAYNNKSLFHSKAQVFPIIAFLVLFFLTCSKDPMPVLLVDLREDLQIKGTISGKVIDTQGKPLSAVHVAVQGKSYTTITLPNGDFTIPDIPAGSYHLTLKRFSFSDTSLENITLDVNQDFVLFDKIVLRSSKGILPGTVLDGNGNTVIGAGITIAEQSSMTITDEHGKFRLIDLLSGQATLIAARTGIGWGNAEVKLAAGNNAPVEMLLHRKGGSVKGRILDEEGNGIAGICVTALGGGITDTTNEKGEYLLFNLPSSIPLKISANPDHRISGLRVTEGGQLSGVDLTPVSNISAHGVTLSNQTIISARSLPAVMTADLRDDSSGLSTLDSIAYFFWDINDDGEPDTITSSPTLIITPDQSWGEEKRIGYGVVTSSGYTIDGATIRIRCVSSVPVVQAHVSKKFLRTGEPCIFSGHTVSLDGNITRYNWAFGDGRSWSRSDTSDVVHRYRRPGLYIATFSATADAGSAVDSVLLTVSGIHMGVALDSLTFSEGVSLDKEFTTDSLYYTAHVPYSLSAVSFKAKALDSNSLLLLGNDTLHSGSQTDSLPLAVGQNSIVIRLIAVDGSEGEYTFSIERQANPDASLSGLTVLEDNIEKEISFYQDSSEYQFSVRYTTSNVTIIPTTSDSLALIIADEDTLSSGDSLTLQLDTGENRLSLKVVAANRTDTATYVLSITRASQPEIALAGISVQIDTTVIPVDLSPGMYSYSLTVPHTAEYCTIIPIAESESDMILVNGNQLNETREYYVDLSTGENSIHISVNRADEHGSAEAVYTLSIYRLTVSDASLSELEVLQNGENILSGFNRDSLHYRSIVVPYSVGAVSFRAATSDSTAIMSIDTFLLHQGEEYTCLLAVGINTVKIKIVSADSAVTQTYTVTIVREVSSDTFLEPLRVSRDTSFSTGSLLNALHDGNRIRVSRPDTLDTIYIIPQTRDPGANIVIKNVPGL